MKKILIVNGPNLNLLGRREPGIYGPATLADILAEVRSDYPDMKISDFQSNHEGALIDCIQQAAFGADPVDGIVLNAGGYTHTSVALADAVAAVPVPVVEVHISNVHAREAFRRHSYLSPVCAATISGAGPAVYALGIEALKKICRSK